MVILVSATLQVANHSTPSQYSAVLGSEKETTVLFDEEAQCLEHGLVLCAALADSFLVASLAAVLV
ncbi:hypothetical protein CYLTODRAFT_423270, partial [Cylindrobasidium torrendii FP15055 ss-10]